MNPSDPVSKLAIVLIVRANQTVCGLERVSLRSIEQNLHGIPKFVLYPADAPPVDPFLGWTKLPQPKNGFGSPKRYSWLLLTEQFYLQFSAYEKILVLHLDVVIFSGIGEFIDSSEDYIGAPWFRREGEKLIPRLAGNGGLSMRRVRSICRILNGRAVPVLPSEIAPLRRLGLRALASLAATLGMRHRDWVRFLPWLGIHEDVYFSRIAPASDDRFCVGNIAEALKFAWETEPRECHRLSGGRLPFGIHGWWKYDRSFVKTIGQIDCE